MIGGLGVVDLAMLALLALSVLVGVLRGLVFELMAIAGWVVAYVAARWFGPALAPWLPFGTPGSAPNQALGFVGVFLGALLGWSLVARLVKALLHATPLRAIDRVGGAAFGAARGALVLLVVATVVAYTPAAQSPLWRASIGAAWLQASLRALAPTLPAAIGPWLPSRIRN